MATQRGRYITFFTLVGDISRRQVIFHVGRWYFTSSSKSRNTREISDIFHFATIHFLPERHSAMVLIYIYLHLLKILCKIPFVCIPTILTNVSSMLVDAVDCGLWWWWWPLPHKITPTNHSLECFCLLQKNQRLLILMYLITNLKRKWRWPY